MSVEASSQPKRRRNHSPLNPGDTFGRLTVVEYAGLAKFGQRNWHCMCVCGRAVIACTAVLRSGETSSCGCYRRDLLQAKSRKPPGESSYILLYGNCKAGATSRGISFELSREEHRALISQNCHYCGATPAPFNRYIKTNGELITCKGQGILPESAERAWITASGVDRLDNTKGYRVTNCVACCWPCNRLKSAMAYDVFIDIVTRISRHISKKAVP